MGAAEVIAFEKVRARKQWDALRKQLQQRMPICSAICRVPQHQLIVNATGADEAGARRRALARAAERLEEVVKRDPRLR